MARAASLVAAVALVLVLVLAGAPAALAAPVVDAGALRARADGPRVVLAQPGHPGATLVLLGAEPAGVRRTVRRAGPGLVRVRLRAPAGTRRVVARFARVRGERFLGFGERSDAVVRTRGTVRHRVTEGPYQPEEEASLRAVLPPPAYTTRDDATYFPVPWLLSSRGVGVLVEQDADSEHRLGDPWSVAVEGRELSLLVVAGPTLPAVLRRFTAHVGRQPAVRPEALGPWWQPTDDEAELRALRAAGALGAVAQTYTHYLPCADHLRPGARARERARTARFARAGLLTTTYFNPMVCTTHPRFAEAARRGLLTRTAAGTPYLYRYTAASTFSVGQLDLRARGARPFLRELLGEAFADGHAGWMEDFGEYTPDDAVAADGTTGSAGHNAYPRDYHGAFHAVTAARRPIRFVRSGWTGSARSSPVVWGGDPTVGWGFDGLASAVRNGLSMGLSGVSRWGSDVGGFFALSRRQTSPELLRRWIQVGFASPVMRTQADGFDAGEQVSGRRAQITDPEVLPVWRRYARLRTRLLPELRDAERTYARTGLPVMRHLALAFPRDRRALGRDDEWLLGDDLLAAPVLRPGRRTRALHLPRGRWVDLWRSADAELERLRRPRVLRGGRSVRLPAPAGELPLLVRWGARLELLPAGGPAFGDAVRAGRARRAVLAWGGDAVRLRGGRTRRYDVQWALGRRPAVLTLDGARRPFTYRDGVLRASVVARGDVIRVR